VYISGGAIDCRILVHCQYTRGYGYTSKARNDEEYRQLLIQAEDRLREEIKNRPRIARDKQKNNPKDG